MYERRTYFVGSKVHRLSSTLRLRPARVGEIPKNPSPDLSDLVKLPLPGNSVVLQ